MASKLDLGDGLDGQKDATTIARDEHEMRVRLFNQIIHSNRDHWEKVIDTELANNRYRIPVELNDLKKAEDGLDQRILNEPVKYLVAGEEALMNFLRDTNEKACKSLKHNLKLDIQGSFGRNHVTPRGMHTGVLSKLMKVEGVVTKAGLTAPKLLQSMHLRKGKEDGHVEQRDHRDATSFVNNSNSGAMPSHDNEGNELQLEVGLSVYKDYQKFNIQEAPENAPAGQIPRSIEVICESDLCDKAKPGDRVQVTGVFKSFPHIQNDFSTGVWPSRLIATNVSLVKEMVEAPFVSDDVKNIKNIAKREDAFHLLSRSYAPAICGHDRVKSGLLLQMIGGTEKNLPNGTHLRGDINVLLIGDPSCGKSQMLRFTMNTAPLAISTTGRGSSGVGLTAAMIREPGSRDFTLEAGAMVLADRGVICIDEFDKMGQGDRVAIHEAMEQQVVTIAKAGMHVTLNARCSVTAAANPIYGNFDPSLDLAKNIGLPDSLLSRFDLVFVVRDLTTEEIDRKIATQVMRQAGYRANESAGQKRGTEQMHSSILERRQEADLTRNQDATEMFEKTVPKGDGEEAPEVLTVDFLRKYIRYCRRLAPKLSDAAAEMVGEKYTDMRLRFQSGFDDPNNPSTVKKAKLAVTTRTLEAIIRLSTAHAKLKLRKDEVLPEDVEEAYKLMLAAREEEVPATATAAEAEAEQEEEAQMEEGASQAETRGRKRKTQDELAQEAKMSKTRFKLLKQSIARVFARTGADKLPRDDLLQLLNAQLSEGEEAFEEEEFDAALMTLEAENKVMLLPEADTKIVHLIG